LTPGPATLAVTPVPVLADNYAYIVRAPCGATAVVDPGQAAPVLAALGGAPLALILLTHHHADHVGGARAVQAATGARIVGPAADAGRLPPLDQAVGDGDAVALGQATLHVLATPGHTTGGLCYHAPGDPGAVFTGDTLFLMGCGRLFEGTAAQMWASLKRIAALPPATRVYPGHEYTLDNAAFCARAEPGNADIAARLEAVRAARAAGEMTVPGTVGQELATNLFLRARDAQGFAELRAMKDRE
jgi:hydroxyacylglutathione hydrolase